MQYLQLYQRLEAARVPRPGAKVRNPCPHTAFSELKTHKKHYGAVVRRYAASIIKKNRQDDSQFCRGLSMEALGMWAMEQSVFIGFYLVTISRR